MTAVFGEVLTLLSFIAKQDTFAIIDNFDCIKNEITDFVELRPRQVAKYSA